MESGSIDAIWKYFHSRTHTGHFSDIQSAEEGFRTPRGKGFSAACSCGQFWIAYVFCKINGFHRKPEHMRELKTPERSLRALFLRG
ncbi:MAG: hypothetical protein CVU57_16970 [Deltaproteobacteria bacterium HGW-Deltaproteobacteria-15]|nr:MAG: hypothetical protein CVU57_16970 [Deltaproteobacteria bacterium HGW-Deltaproteobacteria-15]